MFKTWATVQVKAVFMLFFHFIMWQCRQDRALAFKEGFRNFVRKRIALAIEGDLNKPLYLHEFSIFRYGTLMLAL